MSICRLTVSISISEDCGDTLVAMGVVVTPGVVREGIAEMLIPPNTSFNS